MKQDMFNPDSFMTKVVGAPGRVTGRWAGVKGLPPLVVRTISGLVAGRTAIEFFPRPDAALVLRRSAGPILYRTLSGQVYTTTAIHQEPATLSLFAAHLLLANKGFFPPAYDRLLVGLASGSVGPTLDYAMLVAGSALLAGCKANLHVEDLPIVWFYEVRQRDFGMVDELDARDGIKIADLLSSHAAYTAYLAGQSVAFARVKVRPIP